MEPRRPSTAPSMPRATPLRSQLPRAARHIANAATGQSLTISSGNSAIRDAAESFPSAVPLVGALLPRAEDLDVLVPTGAGFVISPPGVAALVLRARDDPRLHAAPRHRDCEPGVSGLHRRLRRRGADDRQYCSGFSRARIGSPREYRSGSIRDLPVLFPAGVRIDVLFALFTDKHQRVGAVSKTRACGVASGGSVRRIL